MKSFKQFLSESKVVEAYHGSNQKIDSFKYEFTNKGNDQLGSGFYFTSNIDDAKRYGKIIHKVKLTFKNLLDADKKGTISPILIKNLILKSPNLEDSLMNWGDVEYEGKDKVLRTALQNYTISNTNILRGTFNIANDFYGDNIKEFNKAVSDVLGYDGVIKKHEDGTIHYMAFFPEQIVVVE